ncbi:hypothetical protein HYW75_03340 [Candidatus Pacearchaeota archaeon]|nr:hypothetical protein [Candidatus Pacearchaeota archaeon]
MKKEKFFINSVVILLIAIFFISTVYATHLYNRSKVYSFENGKVIRGGNSILKTSHSGASIVLHTTKLIPSSAVTLWWVIFNHPENCTHPEGNFRCGPNDLENLGGNSSIQSSVLYADGGIVRNNGDIDFQAFLPFNNTSGVLFGPGLINPTGADIHLVVRNHGLILPYIVKEQITTFGGGCNNAPNNTGIPGPNTCLDMQFAVHEQKK